MLPPNLQASPIKDGRRILSEKSANACLSPASSPLKRSLIDSSSPKKQLLPSPSFVAQKRPIHQLDDENQGNDGTLRVQRIDSRKDTRLTNPLAQNETSTTTALEDERSPDAMDSEYQHIHQNKQTPPQSSFSNQIQHSPLREEPTRTVPTIPEDPETRKQFIQEKATLLRTRLQNAMRHVRDPQFDRRLSELEAHSRKYPRLSRSTPPDSTKLEGPQKEEDEDENEEEEGRNTPHTNLTTTPRPQTLFSAPEPDDDPMKTPTQTSHPATHPHHDITTTEPITAPVFSRPASPMQLSSPVRQNTDETNDKFEGDSISSSQSATMALTETLEQMTPSQRGDAADGLLKLMNRGEASNTWAG